jgi:hypothetical protein
MDGDDSGLGPLQPISANAVSNSQQQQPPPKQHSHEHSESISSLSTLSSGSARRDSTGTVATTSSGAAHPAASNHKAANSVGDKISQFNTLAMQSRREERKAAEAAIKRAVLGREEAEAEARRFREEALALRKALDEANERERRVGERLEAVMVSWGGSL